MKNRSSRSFSFAASFTTVLSTGRRRKPMPATCASLCGRRGAGPRYLRAGWHLYRHVGESAVLDPERITVPTLWSESRSDREAFAFERVTVAARLSAPCRDPILELL